MEQRAHYRQISHLIRWGQSWEERNMARNLEQTLKDLKQLEAATADLDTRFQELYSQYFERLSQGVGRQLILAAYHLCTEIYPEAFLALSVGQREQLQRQLRQIAAQGRSHVAALTQMDTVSATLRLLLQSTVPEFSLSRLAPGSESSPLSPTTEFPTQEWTDQGGDPQGEQAGNQAGEWGPEMEESFPEDSQEDSLAALEAAVEDGALAEAEASLPGTQPPGPSASESPAEADGPGEDAAPSSPPQLPPWQEILGANALPPEAIAALSDALSPSNSAPPSPLSLGRRHMVLERQVRAILHSLSILANRALRQAKILPDLPEEVLAAAAAADREEGNTTKQPNLISVYVSMGSDAPEESLGASGGDREPGSPPMPLPMGGSEPTPKSNREGRRPVDNRANPGPDLGADGGPDPGSEADSGGGEPGDDSDYRPDVTPLVAISLRLGDIEFADPQLTLRRGKLREALARLRSLSRRYRKLQREKAQAEAAAAWRAIWFEEEGS